MRTALRATLVALIGLLGIWIAPHAQASCHSFTVGGATVTEGNAAHVTVSRDGHADPSSVLVITHNKSATAPGDYTATIERVEFTTELSKTVDIPTTEDKFREDTEKFEVELRNGQGCRTNPNFEYGDPATVTIEDDDAGSTATAEPTSSSDTTAEPTASGDATASPSTSPSPSMSPSASPTEFPAVTFTPGPTPTPKADDDDLEPWLVGLAVGAFVLAGGLAVALTMTRRRIRDM